MEDYYAGGIVIEEKGRDGLSTWESLALVMLGGSVMALAFALAWAIFQLSIAFSITIVAIGLGVGGNFLLAGVANVVLAWGKARALVTREVLRADVEKARAEVERARLEVQKARLAAHQEPHELPVATEIGSRRMRARDSVRARQEARQNGRRR